jgi:CheY-like chemotaxis protein
MGGGVIESQRDRRGRPILNGVDTQLANAYDSQSVLRLQAKQHPLLGQQGVVVGKRSLPPKSVLLVEDHDSVRNVLRTILEEAGYEVLAAARPTEALALCANRGSSLDLVVADFVLPDMDGPQLIEQIRDLHPAIPVLYISGYLKDDVPERRFAEPGAAFLQKPFPPDAFLHTVRDLLRQ